LDDFKPICHMLHRGRHMVAYFACANKTGQHFLLKKFDKREDHMRLRCALSRGLYSCNLLTTCRVHALHMLSPYASWGVIHSCNCLGMNLQPLAAA
jgi:hypothetical protein